MYKSLLAFTGGEKYLTEMFIGEKEKMDKKGMRGKQEKADNLLHNTSQTQYLYHISKA